MNPIQVEELKFSYGNQHVLNGLSIDIKEQYFYSIIGPNGTGKSTLLKLISNLLSTKKDAVFIHGDDITQISRGEVAKKMALVPQNTNVGFDFTVEEVVAMGRTPYLKRFQSETSSDKELIEEALELTDTVHLRHKGINEISGGERQRVIIAKAIAQNTKILLLDEPVSHLDIHHQINILKVLKKLQKNREMTVITVLHDLNLASTFSDELILLNGGKVYAAGRPDEVLTQSHIKDVYDMDVMRVEHPNTSKPYIIPVI